jgi:hypothetical protein
MDSSVIEPSRWNLIFELLSLDGIVPLYEEMGLEIPDKQRFVQMFRRMIAEARQIYGSDRTPDIRFAERVLKEIESLFGEATADHFYMWATTVFYWVHSYQPQWSAWDFILPRHPAQLHESLPPEKYGAINQFRQGHNIEDLDRQIKVLKGRPLSEWDAEMYSFRSYSNVEDPRFEDDLIDPYSPILSTIEMNRFQLAWPKLWSNFTENEKRTLWNYGQKFLRDEEIDMPEPLRYPDSLQREL